MPTEALNLPSPGDIVAILLLMTVEQRQAVIEGVSKAKVCMTCGCAFQGARCHCDYDTREDLDPIPG
jgi:hypothetical protein